MTIDEQLKYTSATAIYPEANTQGYMARIYCALGLAGEAGELANKVKKMIRDGVFEVSDIKAELGDIMWYWSQLCREYGLTPTDVIETNCNKLKSRMERGVIGGSGDNR